MYWRAASGATSIFGHVFVQSGRIEHSESEVKERRAELDAKSAAIRDLETLLQSEREAEHGMSASKAEALARALMASKANVWVVYPGWGAVFVYESVFISYY